MKKRTFPIVVAVLILLIPVAFFVVKYHLGDIPCRQLEVVAAEPHDRNIEPSSYFGFDSNDIVPRNIACVRGTFTLDMAILVVLFKVSSGKIEKIAASKSRRSPSRHPQVRWRNLDITMALGDKVQDGKKHTYLGCIGAARQQGSGSANTVNNLTIRDSVLYTGPVERDRIYLVYVEGDKTIMAHRDMMPEEFARNNPGEYLLLSMYVY